MLHAVAKRILPVVKDLATEDVASNSPIVLIIAACKKLIANDEVVKVGDFERSVMKFRRHPGNRGKIQRVVVNGLITAIAANKHRSDVAIGCVHFVGDQQAKPAFHHAHVAAMSATARTT